MDPTPIEKLLTSAGSIVSSGVTWMGSFLSEITKTGNEVLLLFVLVPLVGLGAGLLKRMMRV